MARDEFWDALKEHAHRNHQERVSKNPDRIAYAIQQFEAHGIEYQLKNQQTGHFHCWPAISIVGGSLMINCFSSTPEPARFRAFKPVAFTT